MFLIDRINTESELTRKSNFLKVLERRLMWERTELDLELKVWTMEKIGMLNRKLYGRERHSEV